MRIIEPTPIKAGTKGTIDYQTLDPMHSPETPLFTNIEIIGGSLLADYSGALPLTEYVESVVQEYRVTLITKTEWRDLLTLPEQILSDKVKGSIEGDLSYLPSIDLESPLVAGVTNRDILRTGYTAFGDAESLEVTNPTVQLVTQTMFVVGILATQERVDTILLGVPL